MRRPWPASSSPRSRPDPPRRRRRGRRRASRPRRPFVPQVERRLLEAGLLVRVDHPHRGLAVLLHVQRAVEAVVDPDLQTHVLPPVELHGHLEPGLVQAEGLEVLLLGEVLLLLQRRERPEERVDGGVVAVRLHRLRQLPALVALLHPRDELPLLRQAQLLDLGLVEVEQLLALLLRFGLLLLVLARPERSAADGASQQQEDDEPEQRLGGLLHGVYRDFRVCQTTRPAKSSPKGSRSNAKSVMVRFCSAERNR